MSCVTDKGPRDSLVPDMALKLMEEVNALMPVNQPAAYALICGALLQIQPAMELWMDAAMVDEKISGQDMVRVAAAFVFVSEFMLHKGDAHAASLCLENKSTPTKEYMN